MQAQRAGPKTQRAGRARGRADAHTTGQSIVCWSGNQRPSLPCVSMIQWPSQESGFPVRGDSAGWTSLWHLLVRCTRAMTCSCSFLYRGEGTELPWLKFLGKVSDLAQASSSSTTSLEASQERRSSSTTSLEASPEQARLHRPGRQVVVGLGCSHS